MSSPPSPSPPPPPRTLALPPPEPSLLLLPPPESKQSKPQSPPKKPPPLPWTHQETLALIQAYQHKWYSLKKGQLKAFQWEEVAATVAARCGFDEPSKTSTQCRHKIEKLRKRYRSELRKPNPNSWQYFELMDRMERGPVSVNARPISVVKSSSNGNDLSHGNVGLYSGSVGYYDNHSNSPSDESDEEWNGGYGVDTKNKSKSINNLVRGDVKKNGISSARVARGSGFRENDRVVRVLRDRVNGKRKGFYNVDDSDEDENEDEDDDEEEMAVEDEGGERKLAMEIRGFAERFMRMESRKIEMMRETERCRMEMEKKRMDMILDAQRKIVDTIGRAFGEHKKARMARES